MDPARMLHGFPNAKKEIRLVRMAALMTNGQIECKVVTLSADFSVTNDFTEDADPAKVLSVESESDPLAN